MLRVIRSELDRMCNCAVIYHGSSQSISFVCNLHLAKEIANEKLQCINS